jgi:hypothetical protein
MQNYIGLDAHSKTCTFVVLDVLGRQKGFKHIKTGEAEIRQFVESVRGSKALVFEEGNLSKWLYAIADSWHRGSSGMRIAPPRYARRGRLLVQLGERT